MVFRLTSPGKMKKMFCGVLEFIAENNTCYLPDWMMKQLELDEGENLILTNVKLPKGTFMKIQPFTKDFTLLPNPKQMYIFIIS